MSKALSLEELLNASDSEEDEDALADVGVDLETILDDSDQSEDDEISEARSGLKIKGGGEQQVAASELIQTALTELSKRQEEGVQEIAFEVVVEGKVDARRLLLSHDETSLPLPAATSAAATLVSTSAIYQQHPYSQYHELSLSSLELADRREMRYLNAGSRDTISALQTKRGGGKSSGGNGVATSCVKLEEMATISSQLKRNASYKQHGPGIATAVHVHAKFFIIGTSSGLCLLFDHSQEIRQVVGSSLAQGTRCHKAVTAIDVTPNGTMLLCGYVSGEIALWDVLKGALLKRVTDLHKCRICRLQFILNVGESFEASSSKDAVKNEYFTVSADAKGVVNKGRFSKALWSSYSAEFDCLLDGSAGVILDMSALVPAEQWALSNVRDHSFLADETLKAPQLFTNMQFVAFNSLTRTYVVQIQPVIRVIHRWTAPVISSPSMGEPVSSSLDWAWGTHRRYKQMEKCADSTAWPILARAWGNSLQILCIDCSVMSAPDPSAIIVTGDTRFRFTLVAEKRFEVGTTTSDVLSVKWLGSERIIVFSTTSVIVMNPLLETLEVSSLSATLAVCIQSSTYGRGCNFDEPVSSSICVHDRLLFVLSPESLVRFALQMWTEQADQLINEGQWLEALALALESLGNADASEGRSEAVSVEQYIRRYVELAVTQPSFASYFRNNSTAAALQGKNHYHLVSGVCIEYCIAAGRLDLLFGEFFDAFVAARQQTVFLDALEPYILTRMIKTLPPRILGELFDFAIKALRLPALERCISFLDLQEIDLDASSRFLLEHRLYSGFLYVYAFGLGDFVGAFQTIFESMICLPRFPSTETPDFPSPEQADIGYKLLLFTQSVSQGKLFPRRDDTQTSLDALFQLLNTISNERFQRREQPCLSVLSDGNEQGAALLSQVSQKRFPYLSNLTSIDPGATMFCLSQGLQRLQEATMSSVVALYDAIFQFATFSNEDLGSKGRLTVVFFDFFLPLMSQCSFTLPLELLESALRHESNSLKPWFVTEARITQLAIRQSKSGSSLEAQHRLFLMLQENNFWKAALHVSSNSSTSCSMEDFEKALIFYLGTSLSHHDGGGEDGEGANGQALESFAKVDQIFEYIDAVFDSLSRQSVNVKEEDLVDFASVLTNFLISLADLDTLRTQQMVCSYLPKYVSLIIEKTKTRPSIQLDLLSALVKLAKEDEDTNRNPGDEALSEQDTMSYIHLLVTFCPSKVYYFLSEHNNYPLDECLALCREKNVLDATALLLEKKGDSYSALSLLLTDLTKRITTTKKDLDSEFRDGGASKMLDILSKHGKVRSEAVVSLPLFSNLMHIVSCIISLCCRFTTSCDLWFTALDHFLHEKQALRKAGTSSSSEIMVLMISELLHLFLSEMEAVAPPQEIVSRITRDKEGTMGSRLSEFRDIFLSMISSFSHDVVVLDTFRKLQAADIEEMQWKRLTHTHPMQWKKIMKNCNAERFEPKIVEDGIRSEGGRTQGTGMARRKKKTQNLRASLSATKSMVANANSMVANAAPPLFFARTGLDDDGERKPGHLPLAPRFTSSI